METGFIIGGNVAVTDFIESLHRMWVCGPGTEISNLHSRGFSFVCSLTGIIESTVSWESPVSKRWKLHPGKSFLSHIQLGIAGRQSFFFFFFFYVKAVWTEWQKAHFRQFKRCSTHGSFIECQMFHTMEEKLPLSHFLFFLLESFCVNSDKDRKMN